MMEIVYFEVVYYIFCIITIISFNKLRNYKSFCQCDVTSSEDSRVQLHSNCDRQPADRRAIMT